jgi:threonine dehydrogenase-like Zn-dependent dehydrogenase
MSAWRGGFFPPPPEGSFHGLGWDIAGIVDAVGPGTVCRPGEPVIALSYGLPLGPNRAQAEYVVVPSNAIAAAPAGIDPVHAALPSIASPDLISIRADADEAGMAFMLAAVHGSGCIAACLVCSC